ncbi:MAG: beta strand repeat-containing protein, partial [Gemmatimonadales bacterium]
MRYARGFSVQPVFPPMLAQAGLAGAIAFDHVRLLLLHADGTTALDTVVTLAPGASQVALTLTVALAPGAPTAGEPMALTMDYVNAAGVIVFHGGPVTVTVSPAVAGQAPPPPVQIPVSYTGPGASAVSVRIAPKAFTAFTGDPLSFTAQAFDASNTVVPNTPIFFAVSDGPATVATNGSGSAGATRGTAHIVAQLITGQTDVATVTVQLHASALALVSGNGQSGVVGSTLGSPVAVQVTASDGIGVGGVPVAFAPASGGSVGNATVTTDANGNASTSWTLGAAAGPQALTVSAAGLTGSPVSVSATATPKPATRLVVTSAPTTTQAATGFGVTVAAQDVDAHVVTGFAATVTIALAGGPAGGVLGGTVSTAAIAGVATFTGLTLSPAGTGYVLTASSAGLTSAQTGPITVTVAPPTKLAFTSGPVGGLAGQAMPAVAVAAVDANGIVTPAFTGTITVGLGSNPSAAALGGTTTATAVAGVATFSGLSVSRGGVGYTLVASATGLTGATSASFNMTAPGAGPVTQLAISVQPGNTVAGASIAPAIVVQARDANGVLATSFTGNVTLAIGTNPDTATISGTITVAAVAGAAAFNNISLNRPGVGYTLVASSGQLLPVTSTAFNILAGAPASITKIAGDLQTATVTTSVAIAPSVRIADALGNGIAGVSVTFSVTAGGGSATGTTVVTNAVGIAAVGSWTMGAAFGANTLLATAGALNTTFTAMAAPAGTTRTWVGGDAGTPRAWTDALNWSPNGVPANTESVFIPAVIAANQPQLTAATTIAAVTVAAGSTLDLQTFQLSINGGAVNATGPIVATTGAVVTASGTPTLAGTLPALTVNTGTTLAGASTTTGATSVTSTLNLGGFSFTAQSNFTVSGPSAHVIMQGGTPTFTVQGVATWDGADSYNG